jgi:hypothetical protein
VGGVERGHPAQAADRQVAVEIGRWRGRPQHAGRRQQHPDPVAGEQGAEIGVEHGHVVLGVAGRVDQLQLVAAAEVEVLAVLGGADTVGLDRGEAAVHGVHERTVDPGRAAQQPLGLVQVPRPRRMDHHGGVGEGAHQVADPAGVVEVDVGDHDP